MQIIFLLVALVTVVAFKIPSCAGQDDPGQGDQGAGRPGGRPLPLKPADQCHQCVKLPQINYFGKTYTFLECPFRSWSAAAADCKNRFGGHLLFIKDVDERDKIAFALQSWFGGRTFGWWIKNKSDGNKCSALFNNFQFKKVDCKFPLRYICEAGDFFNNRPVFDIFVPQEAE